MKIDYLNLKKLNKGFESSLQDITQKILSSGRYLQGEYVKHFEQEYAHFIGTQHCVSCGSGLDALKLIWMAELELGRLHPGDEVLVPANTYIASILSISETGLIPVLVEPSWDTLQIDDTLIEASITPKTKALLLVHLYGRCAMTERIDSLCKKYHLMLIEDNAQAHGCKYYGNPEFPQKTGSIGHAAAHSFYPSKNLGAMGDAGAVTTNDETLANVIRALGNYGSSKKYVFSYRGLNSRMDEIQAAVLATKLPHVEENNLIRMHFAMEYTRFLSFMEAHGAPCHYMPLSFVNSDEYVAHIFPIFTSERDALQKFLKEKGIETMIHYPIPPHQQGCYASWNQLSLPVTEQIHKEELSLPCNPTLTPEEILYIEDALLEFFFPKNIESLRQEKDQICPKSQLYHFCKNA